MPLGDTSTATQRRMDQILNEMKKMLSSAKGRITVLIFYFGQQLPSFLYKKIIVKTKPGTFPSITLTNVPGSSEASTFLNRRVLDMMFWTFLDAGWISFTILSYNGRLKIGCIGHAGVISSEEVLNRICTHIEVELYKSIAETSKAADVRILTR